jgi:type III secretory pathway component EscS
MLVWLPLLGAVMLAVYPLLLKKLPGLPPDEYAQALRAPAWFTVVIGGSLSALSLSALNAMSAPEGGDRVFTSVLGFPVMVDAYTLWSNAILGAALAVGVWVPAARRSITPSPLFPYPVILLLAWLAQSMLFSFHFPAMLFIWVLLLAGIVGLWFVLFRPRRRWQEQELPLVLGFVAVLGVIGLLWLNRLAHGDNLVNAWSILSVADPRATGGIALLLALGFLGPSIYLPWWIWARRDERAMIWLPAVLLASVAAQSVFIHTLYLAFPPASTELQISAGVTPFFLIDRTLGWITAWGLLALLAGSGWLVFHAVMRSAPRVAGLRPLALVAAGMLLLGISVGVQGQGQGGINGLLWLQLTWMGITCVWLASGGMLSALAASEQAERTTVQIACWMSLLVLMAIPPGPAWRGLAALWEPMKELSVPRMLVVFTLVAAGLSAGAALPRWFAQQTVSTPRAGAAWGIIGPFLLAFLLVALGLLGWHLSPLLEVISRSLQQPFIKP